MNTPPRIGAIIEARMRSTRLPGKVLLEAAGKPFLHHMIERVSRVREIDTIVIATTDDPSCDPIEALGEKIGTAVFRGSEDDVMARVLGAAKTEDIDVIVELTGDCPLIDPLIISDVINAFTSGAADYAANIFESGYPLGMEAQVFPRRVLADAASRTDRPNDHEHVSLYIYQHPETYRIQKVGARENLLAPEQRLTLDTPEDLKVISSVFEALYPSNPEFGLTDMLSFLANNPAIATHNQNIVQNTV